MTIKIVTDSTADISLELAKKLGVSIVPVYVRFGEKTYRDLYDIGQDEVYRLIEEGKEKPKTSQPSPADFAETYKKLSEDASAIISIHVTSKLSGTYNAALQGSKMADAKCPIEVIDSETTSVGLGMMSTTASKLASAGASFSEITDDIKDAIANTHILAMFDTLKYVFAGGRLGKAASLLGGILSVKPMLSIKNGVLHPIGIARTRKKGLEKLVDFAAKFKDTAQGVAIAQSTDQEEAIVLSERIGSFIEKSKISISRLGPALGCHGGPGTLVFAVREKLTPKYKEAEGQEEKRGIHLPSIHLPKFKCSSL